jgi:hypothetical protein
VFSDYTVNKLTSMVLHFVSNTCMSWVNFYIRTLIKRKPGFIGKLFWCIEIPFKTGFTVFIITPVSPPSAFLIFRHVHKIAKINFNFPHDCPSVHPHGKTRPPTSWISVKFHSSIFHADLLSEFEFLNIRQRYRVTYITNYANLRQLLT